MTGGQAGALSAPSVGFRFQQLWISHFDDSLHQVNLDMFCDLNPAYNNMGWGCFHWTFGVPGSNFRFLAFMDRQPWWTFLVLPMKSASIIIIIFKLFFQHAFFFFLVFFCHLLGCSRGGSQARGRIGATAADLRQSHSKAGSLTRWARPGIDLKPHGS